MSVKIYREIIKFLKYQREVLRSFERENESLLHENVKKLFETLTLNFDLLEENINTYIDEV